MTVIREVMFRERALSFQNKSVSSSFLSHCLKRPKHHLELFKKSVSKYRWCSVNTYVFQTLFTESVQFSLFFFQNLHVLELKKSAIIKKCILLKWHQLMEYGHISNITVHHRTEIWNFNIKWINAMLNCPQIYLEIEPLSEIWKRAAYLVLINPFV